MTNEPLLSIRDLRVGYRTARGFVTAVDGVSLDVQAGETTALVGESGSGKSTVAQSIIGLLAGNGRVAGGSISLRSTELVGLSDTAFRSIRGRRIGLIPQDPGNSLNPVATIGASVAESLRIHGWRDRAKIRARVHDLLERVDIDDPEARAKQFPHELSGGMRQRVLIAAALALEPELIIADEPTSALDVTVQRRVLDLIDRLRAETGTGVLFITHDLAVAADRSDSIVVMRGGAVQEAGASSTVLAHPSSAYTRTLLADAPSLAQVVVRERPAAPIASAASAAPAGPLVEVVGLRQEFARRGRPPLVAVDDVSFVVPRGTTHALVGESGSGKTTTGRSIAGFNTPTSGTIRIGDSEITGGSAGVRRRTAARPTKEQRRTTQLVYQNPYGSLDPRQTVSSILAEPLENYRIGDARERADRVAHHLELVSLAPEIGARRPRELSGGQRQRVAIARALILEPRLVVLDEAVSALDVTVQAQILRLLARLQSELGLTYVFISHDLAVVRQIADTVSVLRRGQQVEQGATAEVFANAQHPYTRQLLDAIPGAAFRAGATGQAAAPAAPTAPAAPSSTESTESAETTMEVRS